MCQENEGDLVVLRSGVLRRVAEAEQVGLFFRLCPAQEYRVAFAAVCRYFKLSNLRSLLSIALERLLGC